MFKNPSEKICEVSCVSAEKQRRIMDFLQGAVYCWCKNRRDENFSLRILMGGENFYWEGTPLIELYKAKKDEGCSDPVKEAAKCAGWLLKKVLADDKRVFDSAGKDGLSNAYKCIDLKNSSEQ